MLTKRINLLATVLAVVVAFLYILSPRIESLVSNLLMTGLAQSGVRATGIVTGKQISQRKMVEKDTKGRYRINLTLRRSSYGTVYYQFRDLNGKLWRGTDFADGEWYDLYKEGDLISVVYFKKFPFLSKLEPNLEKYYSRTTQKVKAAHAIEKTILLLREDPKNKSLREKLAKLYMDENRYEDCIGEYNSLILESPTSADLYADLGHCYGRKGEIGRAVLFYGKATELAPSNPRHFENLGVAYEKSYRGEEAVAAYKKAITLDPKNKDVVLRLVMILDRLGHYDDGIQYLESYIRDYDNQFIEAYRLLSRLAVRKEDFLAASDYLKRGLEISPKDAELNFELGVAYTRLGDFEKAKVQLRILSEMKDPRYKELKNVVGTHQTG